MKLGALKHWVLFYTWHKSFTIDTDEDYCQNLLSCGWGLMSFSLIQDGFPFVLVLFRQTQAHKHWVCEYNTYSMARRQKFILLLVGLQLLHSSYLFSSVLFISLRWWSLIEFYLGLNIHLYSLICSTLANYDLTVFTTSHCQNKSKIKSFCG